jgi:galactose-1-phosphate uridylyltransferase
MNERLLDICIKAGINTWPFNEVGFISLDESELVKFAELIVQECMSYMEDGDIDFAKFMIRKHFGVKP